MRVRRVRQRVSRHLKTRRGGEHSGGGAEEIRICYNSADSDGAQRAEPVRRVRCKGLFLVLLLAAAGRAEVAAAAAAG